ncbi:glycine cleavage system protein R [Ferruginivarius sediminum]|uniref:ACT domain-containing protein n=1 Tax=Ferruginivarius sediminum TaxID=2661937 RepID=A0A369TC18_9PROT|nr:ACT domain-containing protein [Ferruginivarius sediminum]RDD62859.1 ACT domain-containing protein [Ferruginivarius sediminum]
MSTKYVIAVVGNDRPGLVELLASAVADHQGSWLESRMSVLAGQFAGVALVQVPDEQAAALEKKLHDLSDETLRLTLAKAGAREPARPHRTACLELVGHDRPGIVQEITRVLREKGVNIDDIVTERMSGAMSGGHLFRAVVELQIPDTIELDRLRDDLEGLANELMVDIHVRELLDEGA